MVQQVCSTHRESVCVCGRAGERERHTHTCMRVIGMACRQSRPFCGFACCSCNNESINSRCVCARACVAACVWYPDVCTTDRQKDTHIHTHTHTHTTPRGQVRSLTESLEEALSIAKSAAAKQNYDEFLALSFTGGTDAGGEGSVTAVQGARMGEGQGGGAERGGETPKLDIPPRQESVGGALKFESPFVSKSTEVKERQLAGEDGVGLTVAEGWGGAGRQVTGPGSSQWDLTLDTSVGVGRVSGGQEMGVGSGSKKEKKEKKERKKEKKGKKSVDRTSDKAARVCIIVIGHAHCVCARARLCVCVCMPCMHAYICAYTHTHQDTETDRQTDRQTDRHTDRQTDGHAYTHTRRAMTGTPWAWGTRRPT